MLGRVSSLDWLISIGLLPLSFALTAPGRRRSSACAATLVGAAAIGGVCTLGALFLPGMRDIEGTASTTEIDAERNPDPIADLLVGPQLARG